MEDGGHTLKIYVEKILNLAPHDSQHNPSYVLINIIRQMKKKTPNGTKPLKKAEQIPQLTRFSRG